MNRVFQYLIYPVVWLLIKPFFDVEFRNPEGLNAIKKKSAIIVANHISFYDSFLLRLNPYSVGLSLYFMGVKSFNAHYMRFLWSIGIVPLIYDLFGVFIVHPGQGLKKNLETPVKILSHNNQIFIFPEGSVNQTGELRPFKKGAATLATSMNIGVLPLTYKKISISGKRTKIIVTVGEVMTFMSGTSVDAANMQMEQRMKEMLSV